MDWDPRAESLKQRQGPHRRTVDASDIRRKHVESTIHIRREKRDKQVQEKRRGIVEEEPETTAHGPSTAPKLEFLAEYAADVLSASLERNIRGTGMIRRLLSIEKGPPINPVIQTGVVPKFVEFMRRDDLPKLQFEAAWALTNIASGTTEQTGVVVLAGGIPEFVRLSTSPVEDLREQCVWALGNIAGDSIEHRNLVLQYNAARHVTETLSHTAKLSFLRNASWTLSNFCRGRPAPALELIQPAIPALAKLIYAQDEEIIIDALWALSYLSDGDARRIQSVLEGGIAKRVVQLMQHLNQYVVTPALRIIGNIVVGDEIQTQIVVNNGAVPILMKLLRHAHENDKKSLCKETCWTISNIMAGNRDQIQAVLDANIVPYLVGHILKTAYFEIQKEACWAISNASTGGSAEQCLYLVRSGCIPCLVHMFQFNDNRIVQVALEGISNLLAAGVAIFKTSPYDNEVTLACEAANVNSILFQFVASNQLPKPITDKAMELLRTFWPAELEIEDGEEGIDDDIQQVGQDDYEQAPAHIHGSAPETAGSAVPAYHFPFATGASTGAFNFAGFGGGSAAGGEPVGGGASLGGGFHDASHPHSHGGMGMDAGQDPSPFQHGFGPGAGFGYGASTAPGGGGPPGYPSSSAGVPASSPAPAPSPWGGATSFNPR